MSDPLVVNNLGAAGVNVDLSPIHVPDNQFRKAQNVISNPLGAEVGISNRPGLVKFSEAANGAVLGGIGVPLLNLFTGAHFWYIGRGDKS
jgi:hypothetical protein